MVASPALNGFKVTVQRTDSTSIEFCSILTAEPTTWLPEESFIVIDTLITELYAEWWQQVQQYAQGFILLPAGDIHKNLQSVQFIIDACVVSKLSRRGTIVGVGGGVITDAAGLAANLYYRGVHAMHVPTTLLGMIDAAIGGKVGVNHPAHKNLIGSFYQPKRVCIDEQFMATQTSVELQSGLGEVLKIALIASQELFELLEQASSVEVLLANHADEIIHKCVEHKVRILGENCYERTFDRVLNFGHSVAHPLEDVTHFRIPHGIAVAQGIAVASHIAMQRGLFATTSFNRLIATMQRLTLPLFDAEVDCNEVWQHITQLVLQRGGKSLYYVLPTSLGSAAIVDSITKEEFMTAVGALRQL